MYWTLDDSKPRERRVLRPGSTLGMRESKHRKQVVEPEKPTWDPVDWDRLRAMLKQTMAAFPEALRELFARFDQAQAEEEAERQGMMGPLAFQPSG